MQNNYLAHPYNNSSGSNRYHPYASHPYQLKYSQAPYSNDNIDFSSDTSFGPGENKNQQYPEPRNNNKRFNGRGRFNSRGRFSHRGRGNFSPHGQNSHKPWMTDEILEAIRERNELQKRADETKNPDDWSVFKAVRNRTNMLINDARRLYDMASGQGEPKSVNAGQADKAKKACNFYCDTCDRSFPTDDLLQQHNAEHVVCQLDGCTFTAHPKIILKHIEMQHSNNLFSRVKGFESPEDIEKWKAERRSKYPTAENMRKREEEIVERNKRGERFPLQQRERSQRNFEHKVQSRPDWNNKRQFDNRLQTNGNRSVPRRHSYPVKETSQLPVDAETTVEIQPRPPKQIFTFGDANRPLDASKRSKSEVIVLESFYAQVKVGENGKLVGKKMLQWDSETQILSQKIARTGRPMTCTEEDGVQETDESAEEDESNVITDEEDTTMSLAPVVAQNPVSLPQNRTVLTPTVAEKSNPVVGLVAYSSDSEDDPPEERPIDSRREEGEISEDESVGPAQTLITSSTVNVNPSGVSAIPASTDKPATYKRESSSSKQKLKNLPLPKKRPPRMPKLLKKLLENDIRRERNEIMQVCRFIVENNFFDQAVALSPESVHSTNAEVGESNLLTSASESLDANVAIEVTNDEELDNCDVHSHKEPTSEEQGLQ